MQKIMLFVITVVLSCAAQAQTSACNKVRDGVFKSVADIDGQKHVTIITRAGDKQIEENEAAGLKLEFNVKWTSDCTYELSGLKVVKGSLPGASEKHVLVVKITGVKKDFYQAEISSNFTEGTMQMDFSIIK